MKTLIKPSSTPVYTAKVVGTLMEFANSVHKLHLKTTSFAQHLALNDLYDDLRGHADTLAEQFQGASGTLLDINSSVPLLCSTTEECIESLESLKSEITYLQSSMPYSEIVNSLDEIKSDINKARYKLLFLK